MKGYLTLVHELDSLVTHKCLKKKRGVVKAVRKNGGLSHSLGKQ